MGSVFYESLEVYLEYVKLYDTSQLLHEGF